MEKDKDIEDLIKQIQGLMAELNTSFRALGHFDFKSGFQIAWTGTPRRI